ncbi:uncharacterized protein LOC120629631 [Pararge aegeria]|uniref:uncharacterized protein LOC120629631 n=1 Tax=Pararge aegeria TaxID=116150 RepID=UPI0019D07252|nr:uncharacterized protein LOC120629631 [Pararge aegeria]
MIRSVSEPSLGTITGTIATSGTGRASHINMTNTSIKQHYRGQRLWEGRLGPITRSILMLPWKMWWQVFIVMVIVYKYIVHFLIAYYLEGTYVFLDATVILGEVFFLFDVVVQLLHLFWPIIRLHMRLYRRNYIPLLYDVASLLPLAIIFKYKKGYQTWLLIGRCLAIGRIYRLLGFFQSLNETVSMRSTRKKIYVLEHILLVGLVLHGATCLWYSFHRPLPSKRDWYSLGFKMPTKTIKYDIYMVCWYYCACRFFNTIFGDSFPVNSLEKWFTSMLMIFGYVCMRYRLIGGLTWELVLENRRWSVFVEQYHHMIQYLKFREAPSVLVQQAMLYKEQLWRMKDGILTTHHLKELPVPLQMELIFDINVGHFHDSFLLGDTEESFLRHISLLMRHELYLAGQYVWNQGVVKNGMLFIKRGVLEMLSDEDDESPMIAFKEGTVLGEINLFYSIPSKVTVKAATYVELQVLRRTDFMRAMTENPHMLQVIRNKVDGRIRSCKIKQNAITRYDQNDSRVIRTRYRPMKLFKNHLSGVSEEDPTFVDDSHMLYKDDNNVSHRKFTTEYLNLYKIASNVTTVEEPRICLRATFPWILEPNTDFTNMFDIAHFIMVLYVCVMCPHLATVALQSDWEKVLGTIVIAGLLLNIYIQLTTAIVQKNVRKETVREITEEKMASLGFYLDVVSVFPMYIFTDTLDPTGESIATQIAIMFPTLQVWHIWDYLNKWQRNFNNNTNLLCCTKYCLLILILCYWSGSILYLTACPRNLCRENSWMSLLIYWETKIFVTNDAKHERPMTSSLFFGTSVFTGSGASEISPGTEDLILIVFLLILGAYLSFFYVAKICSIYVLSTQRKLKFKESMRELFYFLSVNHVSVKIKARVKKFFCVQWYYNKAVSSDEIFKDMSSNIQQEILSLEMIETLLCCPLFQDCSRDFLQTLASNSRTIVLPDNEIVQHAADIGRDMYILKMGYCKRMNNQGNVESSFGPGTNIGVVEMLYGLPKVHTVVTTTNCILLHIEYAVLVQCWSTFPDICDPIQQVIKDPEISQQASRYEEGKPLIGKNYAKTNKITQEIKESFVIISGMKAKMQYQKVFDKLGIMRYFRYIFLPGCITPHGIFLKLWCLLRFVLAIYYVIVIPYNIASKQSRLGSSYSWTDILLYVDIVLMAYVAYYDERSLLVTHPLLTLTRYLKHAFILDVLSVFPFEELFKIVNEHADTDLYRMNRILLVFRITGTFSYWETDIMQVNQAVVLLKFLPIAMTLVNFATAFIFMNSCRPCILPNTSYAMVNCTSVMVFNTAERELKYAVSQYIHTLYWVFQVFVGCGCTPVIVSNSTDVWLTMALQITGVLYFAFMFGYISSTRSASSHALLSHNEKTRDLADFLYRENVDFVLSMKTLKYFEYVWKRTHGSDPQKICRGLNSALMEDTLVFMYERALREVPLFGKVERSFIRVITQHLHEMYFLKGDTVVLCKDLQTNIYIIYRGKVDVMSSYNEMITCMGPGGMFGNFTGQPVSISGVAIYASRNLDLLVLPSQMFFNLVKYYPKIHEPLKKAFEMSKDYILPISMDNMDEDSSGDSDLDVVSQDSAFDSRSGSSRYGSLGNAQSSSNMSQSKSTTSVITYQSYLHVNNLLKPGSSLYQIFGYLTCMMATANYVISLYELVTLNDCYIIFWIQSFFDVYFYAKIYVSMHQGYLNRHGNLILDPTKCRARYYRHKLWVWSDLLCNFPFELFGFCFANPITAVHYFRANKLLRLKYLVEFYRKTSAELTNNLTILQTAMTIFIVVLLLHTFTCIWLLTLIATSPHNIVRTLKLHLIDDDMPMRLWDYTSSFYVVVAVLTSTGGDEFLVDDIPSKIILAICLICGKMLAATVIATSMQVAYSARYALNKYEKATWELIDVLKNQGLSSYQLMKFWKYVRMLWVSERGRQLPALIAKTPYVLRCDLMSAMFGQHLRNCFIFAETGEPFLRQLSVLLDYSIYFPGNYIIVAGDSEPRMHWVASGSVAVVSVRPDLTETTHDLLGPGDVFGIMQGLNRGVSHCFSYRAENKVGILTLSLDSWINILPYFPDAERIITERSEILFTQI